jgi:3-hydroxyacyl-CoA dehydrogenase
LSYIQWSSNLNEAVKTADIVIEAIVENLKEKQKMFASIDDIAKPSAIFASNTSSLPIKEIAKTSKRLNQFCGLHFFNPVPVMKLLEIVRIPETSDSTYDAVMKFGKELGKVTVTCKDTPGFIVNRLLNPYMGESYRMLERGDATVEDIDKAMKLGAGFPMGPFELTDLIGIDTARNVRQFYHEVFPNDTQYTPSPLLNKMVQEGKLGVKSGEGFYNYKK